MDFFTWDIFNKELFFFETEPASFFARSMINFVGIELINPYIELVVACNDKNKDYDILMKKLIEWKDSRVKFWQDVEGSISLGNIHEENINENDLVMKEGSDVVMLNKEVVLSVLSLVGSKDSFKANESRKGITSMEFIEENVGENGEGDRIQEDVIEKKVNSRKGTAESADDEKKKVITLHVSTSNSIFLVLI